MTAGGIVDLIGGWGNLIAWVINGFFGWVIWSLRRQFATRGEVEAVEAGLKKLIGAQDRRLLVVEHVVSGIPGKIDRLTERVAAQEATLDAITRQLDRLSQQVNMLLRHEMEDGRK